MNANQKQTDMSKNAKSRETSSQQRTSASSDSAPVQHLEDIPDKNRYSGKGIKINWEKLNQDFQKNIGKQSIQKLAGEWGVSVESLRRLGIGFDTFAAFTFPMKNWQGEIVGIWRSCSYQSVFG